MIRARIGRWGTSVSVTVLLASQVFVGTAAAADTRLIYVGSGPVGTDPGLLTLSPVTTGGTTATNVIVKNIDNQTLTHVILTFAAPVAGLTLAGVFGANASSCAPSATDPLVCDFGNLTKNQTRTFTVLYSATSATLASISATITFNETRPNGGSNTHREPIGGSITITDGGCDEVDTFLAPGHSDPVGTTCALAEDNPQITSVVAPGTVVSAIKVADQKDLNNEFCAFALGCFGQLSVADIATDTNGTVIWTITWLVPSNFNASKLGVLHFPDNSTTPDLNITVKKNTCKTDTATGCFVPGSVTLNGTTLTAVIRTSGNGAMKGFN